MRRTWEMSVRVRLMELRMQHRALAAAASCAPATLSRVLAGKQRSSARLRRAIEIELDAALVRRRAAEAEMERASA